MIANKWKISYRKSIDKRVVKAKNWIVGSNVTKKYYEYQWEYGLEWSEDQIKVILKYSGFIRDNNRC